MSVFKISVAQLRFQQNHNVLSNLIVIDDGLFYSNDRHIIMNVKSMVGFKIQNWRIKLME